MTIALLCPNNHKLFCPETLAGKRGKCPHCGATFRVPELEDAAEPASSPQLGFEGIGPPPEAGSAPRLKIGPADDQTEDEPHDEEAAEESTEEPAEENPIQVYEDGQEIAADDILFLCPEGHHLHGPGSLVDTPGECPVCGEQFLVPSSDEVEEAEDQHSTEGDQLAQFLVGFGGGGKSESESHTAQRPSGPSLGELFESLWAYRAQGATIELHLGDGKVLIPDGYAAQLSRQGQGVFMRREANGSQTLAVVNWESISHVAVRGVRNLPEGLFA